MERFKVSIFSYGYGPHEYYIEANTAPEAVEMTKDQAREKFPAAQYHELSAIFQALYVNKRGELVTWENARG
jgi:hypothetical protein